MCSTVVLPVDLARVPSSFPQCGDEAKTQLGFEKFPGLLTGCFSCRYSKLVTMEALNYPSHVKGRIPILESNYVSPGKLVPIHSPRSECKSFRKRSNADCSIPVKKSRLSIVHRVQTPSSWEPDKHEIASSHWLRVGKMAAKIGSGLSRNGKAKKLATRYWLEAIDEQHRHGRNLLFYFNEWCNSHTRQPFFYWLDVGEGKEVNLVDKCPRSKLAEQCIKYLTPRERKLHEVTFKNGRFLYKQTGELLHTTADAKWIFVLSTSNNLYVEKKKVGHFQHSSFLAGGAITAAGSLVIENGNLKAVWPHSGHYQPLQENILEFVKFLCTNSVDLTDVKVFPVKEQCVVGYRGQKTTSNATQQSELGLVGSTWTEVYLIFRKRGSYMRLLLRMADSYTSKHASFFTQPQIQSALLFSAHLISGMLERRRCAIFSILAFWQEGYNCCQKSSGRNWKLKGDFLNLLKMHASVTVKKHHRCSSTRPTWINFDLSLFNLKNRFRCNIL